MTLSIYKIRTEGLYESGTGFLSMTKARSWADFWDALNYRGGDERPPIFIRYAPPRRDDIGCGSLVTTGGGGYLHPEGICLINREIGSGPAGHDPLKDELERLFAEVCKRCGASYRISAKRVDVDDSDMEVRI